jgi:hypothetical protein
MAGGIVGPGDPYAPADQAMMDIEAALQHLGATIRGQ